MEKGEGTESRLSMISTEKKSRRELAPRGLPVPRTDAGSTGNSLRQHHLILSLPRCILSGKGLAVMVSSSSKPD